MESSLQVMRQSHVSEPKRSRYFRSIYSYCSSLALLAATAASAQENPVQPPQASTSSAAATAPATKKAELGWLKGKWVFDQEFTEKKYSESKPAEGLTALANGLVYPQLVSKLKGSNVSFKEGEMIMTTADGNGKAYAITIIDPPNSDSVTIKDKDG